MASATTAPGTRSGPRPASVLIVDDDADLRALMAEMLELEGHEVAQAADGEEALRYLRGHGHPRVIVLDLSMPGMDGWQLHRELESDSTLAAIPVVVVSASRDGDRPVPVGADRFLAKPFDVEEFHRLVARCYR